MKYNKWNHNKNNNHKKLVACVACDNDWFLGTLNKLKQ